jgi:hypothetical protein
VRSHLPRPRGKLHCLVSARISELVLLFLFAFPAQLCVRVRSDRLSSAADINFSIISKSCIAHKGYINLQRATRAEMAPMRTGTRDSLSPSSSSSSTLNNTDDQQQLSVSLSRGLGRHTRSPSLSHPQHSHHSMQSGSGKGNYPLQRGSACLSCR